MQPMSQLTEPLPPKDKRLNPARLPIGEDAKALVGEIRNQLLNFEAKFRPRQRARREVDQQRFDRIVSAIICDLMHSALRNPQAWRHVSLSKKMRPEDASGAPFMTATRIDIIRWMSAPEMNWLELRKAAQTVNPFDRKQSTIRASVRLRMYMEEHEIGFEDLSLDPELLGDPIELKSEKVKGRAKKLPVPEGEPACTFRAALMSLNSWLASADIASEGTDSKGRPLDAGDRWQRRIFNNGRLDHGGRIYGGFWHDMGKNARIENISIQGEPVVSLDIGQCAINIAYAEMGAVPPKGDLYSVPGLEDCREGVKALLNAQLHRPKEMARFPRKTRKLFPKRYKVGDVVDPILRHHAAILPLLHNGFGMKGFFIESQILMRSLLELMNRGVVALPIHDCVVVALPDAAVAREVMKESFREVTGALVDVEIDGTCAPMPSGAPLPGLQEMSWIRSIRE